jgi:hypothetical protein
MKKSISLELAIMPMVPLTVVIVVASIIPAQRKYEFHLHDKKNVTEARIKGLRLKTCYNSWCKQLAKHLAGSKVASCFCASGFKVTFRRASCGTMVELVGLPAAVRPKSIKQKSMTAQRRAQQPGLG